MRARHPRVGRLNHDDFNHDLNRMIFLSKKSFDLNDRCLYTLNPLYAKISDIFNTSTTYLLFEIVSVFIYSLIKYVVKIEPCYFCLEHTTCNTHSVRQSYIVYEFRFPGSSVKLHYCKVYS